MKYQGNLSTKGKGEFFFDYEGVYIVCEVVGLCNIVLTLYILSCLITYGIKTKKFRFSGRKSDVNGGLVFLSATVAVGLIVPRYISSQVIFNAPYIQGGVNECEALLDVGNACYFVAAYSMYIFLWLRQKALYGHPAMKKLAGKSIAVFSWITLVVLSAAAIAVLLWFVIPADYTYNETGCIAKNQTTSDADDKSYQVYYLVLVGLLLLAQVSLLVLFIYPMLRTNAIQNVRRFSKHTSVGMEVSEEREEEPSRRRSKVGTYFNAIRNTTRKLSTSSNGKSNTVQKTIRRSVSFAAIAMVSDILAMVLASFVLSPKLPRSVNNTVYDVGLLISALCVLATFSNYRSILQVCCGSPSASDGDKTLTSNDETRKHTEKLRSFSVEALNFDDVKPNAMSP